jgi:hypothetical protein
MAGNSAQRRRLERAVAAKLAKAAENPPTDQPSQTASATLPSDSLPTRLLRFAEQPLFLAAFGALVGSVAGLFYNPLLAFLAVLIVLAFYRAGVVKGKSLAVQGASYLVLFLLLGGVMHWMESHLKKPPVIDIQPPTFAKAEASSLTFLFSVTNIGESVARKEMAINRATFQIKDQRSEDRIFADLRRRLNTKNPNIEVSDQLPGIGSQLFFPAVAAISPAQLRPMLDNGLVLYVAALVSYVDSDGHVYNSEACSYFIDVPPMLPRACTGHNVSGVRQP